MEEIARTQEQGIIAEEITPELMTSFVEWIDRPGATTRTYLTNLRQFAAWLAYSGITQPGRQDIIAYRQWLLSDHEAIQYDQAEGWTYRTDAGGRRYTVACRPSTVAAYLRTVKQFFSWTASSGIYPNIAEGIHVPKTAGESHKDILQPEEVVEVEESILSLGQAKEAAASLAAKDSKGRTERASVQDKRLYAMYLLAVNAGLRTIELHRADVKDFVRRGSQSWLYVWGKGHSEADTKIALAPEVADAIRDYLNARTDRWTQDSPLFVSTGNRSGGKRIATTTISTMLKRAMQAAGYDDPRLTAHSLRHTAGVAVMEVTGENLYKTQRYMRHASPVTTEVYLHALDAKEDAGTASSLYEYYHAAV